MEKRRTSLRICRALSWRRKPPERNTREIVLAPKRASTNTTPFRTHHLLTQESQRGGVVRKARPALAVSGGGRQHGGRQALRERRHVDYGPGHGVEGALPQIVGGKAGKGSQQQTKGKTRGENRTHGFDQRRKQHEPYGGKQQCALMEDEGRMLAQEAMLSNEKMRPRYTSMLTIR